MPTPFAFFVDVRYVGDQFSIQSMMTPTNLVSVTSIILFPSIDIHSMDRGTHFCV